MKKERKTFARRRENGSIFEARLEELVSQIGSEFYSTLSGESAAIKPPYNICESINPHKDEPIIRIIEVTAQTRTILGA